MRRAAPQAASGTVPKASRALLGLVALAFALSLLVAPAASAHAELASSDPMQGARLERPPARVTVTLTEPVERAGTALGVVDQANQRVDLGDLQVTPGPRPVLSVGLPADLPAGAYRIVWRALSNTDGHPSSGTVGFALGSFEAPDADAAPGIPAGTALARFVAYAGFSLAFGAAAFLLWMAPVGYPTLACRVALLAGATLHAAGTLLMAANTSAATGIPLGDLGTSEVGQILLARVGVGVAAWVLALVWTLRPVQAGPAIVTVLLLASALGSARVGHAYLQGPAMMALDLLHLVSAATWAGGLALLLYLLWSADRRGEGMAAMRQAAVRFGTLAMLAVATLGLTGIVVAVAILGPERLARPMEVLGSPYGAFLAGKVALAALMVALAAVNRYVLLQDAAESGVAARLQKVVRKTTRGRLAPGAALGRLRRTVAVEAALGVVVLVLAGFLASVPPPAQAAPEPLAVDGVGTHYRVRAEMEEPRVGMASVVHLAITPIDPNDAAVTNNTCGRISCVGLELFYAGSDAPEEHRAYPAEGVWMVHDAVWGQPGEVTATVIISTADHFEDRVNLTFTVSE